eukprot:2829441-Heterocapsa_arctica.AAC.1
MTAASSLVGALTRLRRSLALRLRGGMQMFLPEVGLIHFLPEIGEIGLIHILPEIGLDMQMFLPEIGLIHILPRCS